MEIENGVWILFFIFIFEIENEKQNVFWGGEGRRLTKG